MENVDNLDSDLEKIQQSLFSFIFSLVHNRQDAQDILQDVNLIICKKKDEFNKNKGSLKTWCFKIARFQVMGFITKSKRSKLTFCNELADTLTEEFSFHDPLDKTKEALEMSYKELPEHMSEIAHLRFKENKSLKQISKQVNRPVGSVSATLFRIRKNLLQSTKEKINYHEVYGRFKNE